MKKIVGTVLCLIFVLFALSACTQKAEVSREPIDHRYTAPYDSVDTDYQHTYDVWKGEFVLVPYVRTVHHDAEYEILYRITYDDGSTTTRWEYVGETEYERFAP